jgi:putative peptidoglycan lipid II flippase
MSSCCGTGSLGRRIAASTGIVSACVLTGRVLGFVRDWTLAHQVGSNAATDAYYAAFTLPDFLNYLAAGGSLTVIFLRVFTKHLGENREDEAWYVFSTVVTFCALFVSALVVVAEIFAPKLILLISPGFNAAGKAQVVFLTRLMLPAQVSCYVGTILGAVQFARGRFLTPSLASVNYSLGIVLGGQLLSSRLGVTGFAIGVLAGAFVGFGLLQVYGARRAGARYRPNLHLGHPGFRLFLKLAVPIMLPSHWSTLMTGLFAGSARIFSLLLSLG